MTDYKKRVFSAEDTAPATLYAKLNNNTDESYPVFATTQGSLKFANQATIMPYEYDKISCSTGATTDIFVYTSSGTTVGTITITYTDSNKITLSTIVRT